MNEIIERHKDNIGSDSGYKEIPLKSSSSGTRLEIQQNAGKGWLDFLNIDNGMSIGLCDYYLQNKVEGTYSGMDEEPFQLNILVSGYFDSWADFSKKQRVVAGDVWFSESCYERAFFTQPAGEKICGVSLILTTNLVNAWLDDCCCEASRAIEKFVNHKSRQTFQGVQFFNLLTRGLPQTSPLMNAARTLLYTARNTFYDKLQFESLSLDLLSRIFTLESNRSCPDQGRTREIRSAVDEAVDILLLEWESPPTISTLARQVGLNECYLKKGFRKHLGLSIGEYVRELRMNKAMELIESGKYSVLETALSVGYSNPSHFSAAFKRVYGNPPSYYNKM